MQACFLLQNHGIDHTVAYASSRAKRALTTCKNNSTMANGMSLYATHLETFATAQKLKKSLHSDSPSSAELKRETVTRIPLLPLWSLLGLCSTLFSDYYFVTIFFFFS